MSNTFARIIEDSISPDGVRLTTFHGRYWRPVHAEVMTHRVFSRNGRSGRAVPVKTLLAEPLMEPLFYGSNKSGMSAGEELTGWRYLMARAIWLGMAHMTRLGVRGLHFAGLHKQWANRPLEPYGCIDTLITATDFKNWDALRIESGAAPEIHELAERMWHGRMMSIPTLLHPGDWHTPYVKKSYSGDFGVVKLPNGQLVHDRGRVTAYWHGEINDGQPISVEDAKKLSVARCARLTYKPFDGAGDLTAEIARHDRLVVSQPVHASPAEHQATPDRAWIKSPAGEVTSWSNPTRHGNLRGWCQYRKFLENEWVPG